MKPASQGALVEGKQKNMRKAAGLLSGLVLHPRTFFSFYDIIGEPRASLGWCDGPTFVDQETVGTPGGGLCQISTVIHWAAMEAGLTILERHPHSIDVYGEARYFRLGLDASVSYPRRDLVVANPYDHPIVLFVSVDDEEADAVWTSDHAVNKRQTYSTLLVEDIAFASSVVTDLHLVRPGLMGRRVLTEIHDDGGTRVVEDVYRARSARVLDSAHESTRAALDAR
jgi:vancomycin resistance protein YoaR